MHVRTRRPRRAFLSAAAALLLAGTAVAGDLEEGLELHAAGRFEEARPKLEKAHLAAPADAKAALAYSEVLAGLGQYELAAKVLREAIDANPDDVALMLARGRAYLLAAAKADAERADPNMIMAYVADADRWIKKVLEKDPKHADARVLKAKTLLYSGATDESAAMLAEVVADTPAHFDAHWELGQISVRRARQLRGAEAKAQWAAAEKHFRDAHAADPKSGQAYLQATYAKAWQGVSKEQTGALVQDYGKAGAMLPGDEGPVVAIWKLARYAPTEVRAELAKLAKAPQGGRAKAFLAVLDADAAASGGKGADAVRHATEAMDALGKDFHKLVFDALNGVAYNGASLDKDDREKLWTALWKKWPDRFDTANNAGLWYRDVGNDARRSAEWYLRAAAAAPNSVQVLNDTGLIYHYNLNELDKAEPWYRKAIAAAEEQGLRPAGQDGDGRKDPEGVGYRDALNNMARLLATQKRFDELKKFAEEHMPEDFPGRDRLLSAGKGGQ